MLNVTVDIHGVERDLAVLVDTGFTSGTGYGLKLPSNFADYAMATGTAFIMVADGRRVEAATIPDARIVKIDGHRLGNPISVPALFMDGPRAIGVMVLQNYNIDFDGPNRRVSLTF